MIEVRIHENGETRVVEGVEPAWLDPASKTILWVDLIQPMPEEGQQVLAQVFHFHPLAVEDALSEIHHPKIEAYEGYLYLILHGINYHQGHAQRFATRDVDFFVGRNYLVTVHDGHSRSLASVKKTCDRREDVMSEGPIALLHRIVDRMVDNYRPEIDRLEEEMDLVEDQILGYGNDLVRQILSLKRDLAGLRRVVIPQRDLVGRLARREFSQITDELTYRFRDVYDHLVRLSDEATMFQDRVTGILDAHLSAVSNRLNEIMKVLTVMSTIFLPLTVLTGMWGMNVPLPFLPGGPNAQFWWIAGIMAVTTTTMLVFFRRRGWI